MIDGKSDDPLCVIEVGTASGTGTTKKLFKALQTQCSERSGREFSIYTYESNPDLSATAALLWANEPNVIVLCDMIMLEDVFSEYVINAIQGPEGDVFPGRGYFQALYGSIKARVASGEIGGFFRHRPPCVADLVLIDSTRYAHAGIVATLLSQNTTRPGTVFLIENDFWSQPDGDERSLLERHWRLADVVSSFPVGEMWPWLVFRIDGEREDQLAPTT